MNILFALLISLTCITYGSAFKTSGKMFNSKFDLLRVEQRDSSFIYRKSSTNPYLIPMDDEYDPSTSSALIFKQSTSGFTSINSQLSLSSSYFRFFFPLSIGTPAVKQLLLFNSLRSITYVQEKECNPCFKQPSAKYSISASSTSKVTDCNSSACASKRCTNTNACAFNSTVSPAFFQGIAVTDTLTIPNAKTTTLVKNVAFRAVRYSTNFTYGDADGIASFGPGTSSLTSQLSSVTGRNAFSLCLAPFSSTNSSKLVIGKDAITPSGISYTPLLKNSNYLGYHLQIKSIFVGGKKVGVPESVFTFDSTNTNRVTILESSYELIGLAQAAYSPVTYMIRKRAKAKRLQRTKNVGSLSPCYLLNVNNTSTLNNYFPSITIRFSRGAVLRLAGYQYVYPISENVVCSFIVNTGTASVIGSLATQNVLVVYDVDGGRIGFKPTDCTKS